MTLALKPGFPLRPLVALVALASVSAHAAPPGAPDAGSILQQLQPPATAVPPATQPALRVEPQGTAPASSNVPFEVKEIRITGNTALPTDALHALVADREGQTVTLDQLEELATRITALYRSKGFTLSRAIVPAQRIRAGVVTIQVIEARYGDVHLHNESKVSDRLLNATLAPLQTGDAITDARLDRSLLLLSDIPGVSVGAVLKPGTEVGTSDLNVTTQQTASVYGNAVVDNFGNQYVGRARASGSVSVLDPLHIGDVFNVSALTTGEDMNYGRVGYDALLNGLGTRAGVSYSYLHYKLGHDLRNLDAHGTAGVASAWVRQPLLRSRQANVYAQLEYDQKRLLDRVDTAGTRDDRHLGNVVLSLNGDTRDGLLRGGINAWSLGWTSGRTTFDDGTAQAFDAATACTEGHFSKWNLNASRLQGLSARDSVYLNFAMQWSDSNLDSAEKMSVGGPSSVRAYDIGALSADTGFFGSVEWRHELGNYVKGRWQVIAFIDSASVKINRHPWISGTNSATLTGAGLGVTWTGQDNWQASATLASRIGGVPSMVAAQPSARAWLTLAKAF
jgi:hemolysin activation/secretion protein